MPQRYIRIIVFGKVQGVFFRKYTKIKANELGIKGFVKNQSDKSVLIEAVADDSSINFFIEFCKKGPSGANVTRCELEELKGEIFFTNFVIAK